MKTDTEPLDNLDFEAALKSHNDELRGTDNEWLMMERQEMASLLVFCERCHDFIRARFKDGRADRIFDGDNREMDVRVWASKEKLAICWERVV